MTEEPYNEEMPRHHDLCPHDGTDPDACQCCVALTQAETRVRTEMIGWFQRYQSAGSPPPGDARVLVEWIVSTAREQARAEERKQARKDERTAVEIERERCCRAVCTLCAAGVPRASENPGELAHRGRSGRYDTMCEAAAIRSRGAERGEGK